MNNTQYSTTDYLIKFNIIIAYLLWCLVCPVWVNRPEKVPDRGEDWTEELQFCSSKNVQLTKDIKSIPLISRLPFCSLLPIRHCQCLPVHVQRQELRFPKGGSGCLPWNDIFKNIARSTIDPGYCFYNLSFSPATKHAKSVDKKIPVKDMIDLNSRCHYLHKLQVP